MWVPTRAASWLCGLLGLASIVILPSGVFAQQGWQQSGSLQPIARTVSAPIEQSPRQDHLSNNRRPSTLQWRRPSAVATPHHVPTEDVFFDDEHVRAGNAPINPRRAMNNPMRQAGYNDYNQGTFPTNQVDQSVGEPVPPNLDAQLSQRFPASGVRQAGWSSDAASNHQSVAPAQFLAPPAQVRAASTRKPQAANAPAFRKAERDFFSNPFGAGGKGNAAKKRSVSPAPPASSPQPNRAPTTGTLTQQLELPPLSGNESGNPLRGAGEPSTPPPPKPNALPNTQPLGPPVNAPVEAPADKPNLFESLPNPDKTEPLPESNNLGDGPSLPDLMEKGFRDDAEDLPAPKADSDTDDSPSDRKKELFDSPFDSDRRDREADKADLERLNQRMRRNNRSGDDPEDGVGVLDGKEDDEKKVPVGLSCDEFRQRIARETIDTISLDISPPFRPDEFDEKEYQVLKDKFDAGQVFRQWTSMQGTQLGSGRLLDLAYEKVVIQNEVGANQEIQIDELSEADLAYISKNWGLPNECRLEQVAYVPRCWQPHTVTWKASNLCHKPLYFEEVNLERYGHTAGPILQPVVSSAHFFANIAVLPYKMGIHPPNECQYALGYYRPGDCAPWILPPVPLSARGAAAQAAALTTGFWLIP